MAGEQLTDKSPPRPPSTRRARWRRVSRALLAALLFIVAQAAGLAFALTFARSTYPVGPVEVTVSTSVAWPGGTSVLLPPLGRVSARTHRLPVALELMPVQLRINSIQDLLKRLDDRGATLAAVRRDAADAFRSYALRLAVLAFLGGCLGALLFGRRRARYVAASGMACLGLAGGAAWAVVGGYNPRAFRQPTYTGVLSEAPIAIEMVRAGFSDLNRVRRQLRNTAANLGRTYAELSATYGQPDSASLRVLHVSDIHNNPAGMDLTTALAGSFRADLVLCTGDFTDGGTLIENRLLGGWRALAQPRIFVSGNHDSRATMAALDRIPGATLLHDGQPLEALGLRLVGWNDPVSYRAGLGDADTTPVELAGLEEKMRTGLTSLTAPVDLVVLHNYRAADTCAGLAPVFAFGHDHRARVYQRGGSWMVDAGTTGAAGIRYFTGGERPPLSAALLYFSRPAAPARPRLQAVDLIQVHEPTGDFTVQRTSVHEAAASGATP